MPRKRPKPEPPLVELRQLLVELRPACLDVKQLGMAMEIVDRLLEAYPDLTLSRGSGRGGAIRVRRASE